MGGVRKTLGAGVHLVFFWHFPHKICNVEVKCRLTKMNLVSHSEKIKYFNMENASPKFVALDLKNY
jgi:hypothetical protein